MNILEQLQAANAPQQTSYRKSGVNYGRPINEESNRQKVLRWIDEQDDDAIFTKADCVRDTGLKSSDVSSVLNDMHRKYGTLERVKRDPQPRFNGWKKVIRD